MHDKMDVAKANSREGLMCSRDRLANQYGHARKKSQLYNK